MSVLEVIRARRSIRRYRTDPVPDEVLYELLEAARWAPSSKNRQPWRFVIVKDSEKRRCLAELCPYGRFLAESPVVIVALSDPQESPWWHDKDTAIAVEHIVLAAAAKGLGTCWIGSFNEQKVRELVRAPEHLRVVALLALGYPAEEPPPRPRKPLTEIAFIEKYGQPFAPPADPRKGGCES